MIVVVVLDHNVRMLVLIICEWLGLQSVGQIHVLGSYSRDQSTGGVGRNGLAGCGASEAAGVSKVANAHG